MSDFKQPVGVDEFKRVLLDQATDPKEATDNRWLEGVAIWNAVLPGQKILRVDIAHGYFWTVNFDGLTVSRSQLFWDVFSKCSLRNTRWTDVTTKIPIFLDCDLERAKLQDVSLYHGRFIGCSFRRASFRRVRFTGCLLVGNQWEGASFNGTRFDGVGASDVDRASLCVAIVQQALNEGYQLQAHTDDPDFAVLRHEFKPAGGQDSLIDTLGSLLGVEPTQGYKRRVLPIKKSLLWQMEREIEGG